MFGIIKKLFAVLLASIVNHFNDRKCVSLSNQNCKIQSTLFNLHPNKYNQELHCSPFSDKVDRCVGSCNYLNRLSNKVSVLNKTKDLNIYAFNMISSKCKCKFVKGKCNSSQKWNNDKCRWNCKKHHICDIFCLVYFACIFINYSTTNICY